MKGTCSSRREFLKTSAAGAAGIAIISGRVDEAFAQASTNAWTNGMQITPDIDNLDVVCCTDPKMMTAKIINFSAAGQNTPVDKARVARNLDLMAQALVRKKKPAATADEAWKTIFRSSKPWPQTKVAIKVNCLNKQNAPRIAIIDKLCQVLNGFGVPFGNIVLYDAMTNANPSYQEFIGKTAEPKLPAVVAADNVAALGNWANTTIPGLTGTFRCCGFLLDSSIDILINLAVNKGQETMRNMAWSTLTMKNHYGSFDPTYPNATAAGHGPAPYTTGGTEFLLGISKHQAILGGTPVRQQLCVVDSLVASLLGPRGLPDRVPNTLVMGAFSPAVDYLTITKIRKPWDAKYYDEPITTRLLTEFGYTPAPAYDFITIDPEAEVRMDAGTVGGGDASTTNAGGAGGGATGAGGAAGAGNGGATGSGGAGNGVGGGSGNAGSGNGGSGGSGGVVSSASTGHGGAAGGTSGGARTGGSSGCDVGQLGPNGTKWGALLAVGTVIAGQIRRLFVRRQLVSSQRHPVHPHDTTGVEAATDERGGAGTPE